MKKAFASFAAAAALAALLATAHAVGQRSHNPVQHRAAPATAPSPAPAQVTQSALPMKQILADPGFEDGLSTPSPWHAQLGVIDKDQFEPAHSGTWKAWLGGYGTTHTDTLYQQVALPSGATVYLSFWLHVDTYETTTTVQFDKLTVEVRDTSDAVLSTLATYSNLDNAVGYKQAFFDVSPFQGKTVRIYFKGVEDTQYQTSFIVDDVALNSTAGRATPTPTPSSSSLPGRDGPAGD